MAKAKKVLILGASSYIGRHMYGTLGGELATATYYRNPITNGIFFDSLSAQLSDIVPSPDDFSHAVLLLGDTRAEYCAASPDESYALNVDSIKRIIDSLIQMKIKPVYASSEWVFDGSKGNYVESDATKAILTYGQQKVEIEEYLQTRCDHFTIVRLSKVFGTERGDETLFTTWVAAIERHENIRCAQDQVFSPIHIKDAIDSILRLVQLDCDGIYHISNPNAYSRLELLEMLLSKAGDQLPQGVEVTPCSINDFDLLEKRPLNVSMNPDKLLRSTGIEIHAVEHALDELVLNAFGSTPGSQRLKEP